MEKLKAEFDSENLHEIISKLPTQLIEAWNFTNSKFNSEIENIVICGMGGSALPANILKTYLQFTDFNLPITINRDYNLPKNTTKNSGIFIISYSGNTEEVLNCLKEAEEKNYKNLILIANNGQVKKIAEEKNYQFIQIPDAKQPRMGYGYFFSALLKTLVNSQLLKLDFSEVEQAVEQTLNLKETLEKQGQELAQKTQNKLPIIYTSNQWKYLAMIWKINLNENAKTQSFWNCFPELNHNEMVGFTNILTDYQIIILQDPEEIPQNIKRMTVFKEVLQNKISINIIKMPSGKPLLKILTTLSLGLWTSYYLALINKVDPTPVDLVEKFKKLI